MANILTAGNSSNGGTAISTDTSGTLNIVTGSGSGANAITIDASQVVTIPGNLTVTGTLTASGGVSGSITRGTAIASTSGTSIDFTSIPSTVKRITVMLRGVSTNGTSIVQVQLGDAGGIETTGYAGSARFPGAATSFSSGFLLETGGSAAYVREAVYTLTNISGNNWIGICSNGLSNQADVFYCAGSKSLSDTLTQVRITTVNGTDAFDAGSINILYE